MSCSHYYELCRVLEAVEKAAHKLNRNAPPALVLGYLQHVIDDLRSQGVMTPAEVAEKVRESGAVLFEDESEDDEPEKN